MKWGYRIDGWIMSTATEWRNMIDYGQTRHKRCLKPVTLLTPCTYLEACCCFRDLPNDSRALIYIFVDLPALIQILTSRELKRCWDDDSLDKSLARGQGRVWRKLEYNLKNSDDILEQEQRTKIQGKRGHNEAKERNAAYRYRRRDSLHSRHK